MCAGVTMKWYDVEADLLSFGATYNFSFGGRGIGKTYSTLKYLIKENLRFIYLRTYQTEVDLCANGDCNPFKKLNSDTGSAYEFKKISKDITGIYDSDMNNVGYALALSTFAKLRGVDFSDIDFIMYEEFNTSGRPCRNQGSLFFNFYETVNRNRELDGKDPVKVVFLGNALSIANPIMVAFNLVSDCEWMLQNGNDLRVLEDRGIAIQIVNSNNEVSVAKRETALYKAIRGTEYYEHAVDNKFINDSFFNVRRLNINEFKPLCTIGSLNIYLHKSQYQYYVRRGKVKCRNNYTQDELDKFDRIYGSMLRNANIDCVLFYADYETKTALLNLLY